MIRRKAIDYKMACVPDVGEVLKCEYLSNTDHYTKDGGLEEV